MGQWVNGSTKNRIIIKILIEPKNMQRLRDLFIEHMFLVKHTKKQCLPPNNEHRIEQMKHEAFG